MWQQAQYKCSMSCATHNKFCMGLKMFFSIFLNRFCLFRLLGAPHVVGRTFGIDIYSFGVFLTPNPTDYAFITLVNLMETFCKLSATFFKIPKYVSVQSTEPPRFAVDKPHFSCDALVESGISRDGLLARYVKWVAHAPGVPGTFFPTPRFSDPNKHYGTCFTQVSWCMPGSLTSGFLWSWWRGKRSRYSRRMHNPRFYVSGKRSKGWFIFTGCHGILGCS